MNASKSHVQAVVQRWPLAAGRMHSEVYYQPSLSAADPAGKQQTDDTGKCVCVSESGQSTW